MTGVLRSHPVPAYFRGGGPCGEQQPDMLSQEETPPPREGPQGLLLCLVTAEAPHSQREKGWRCLTYAHGHPLYLLCVHFSRHLHMGGRRQLSPQLCNTALEGCGRRDLMSPISP